MKYLTAFRMPTPVKITGRSSSITNAFVNSIIPVVPPTEAQVEKALTVLRLSPDDLRCAYCGDPATEWDHLNPLVKNRKPTGYVSEIANLVPACGKCNQSKGNKDWKSWMLGTAPRSPASRSVADLDAKVRLLEEYERTFHPEVHDFEALAGSEYWKEHWQNLQRIMDEMKSAQELAARMNERIRDEETTNGR